MKKFCLLTAALSLAITLVFLTSCSLLLPVERNVVDDVTAASDRDDDFDEDSDDDSDEDSDDIEDAKDPADESAASSECSASVKPDAQARIYEPNELLSAEEAAAMVGFPVTLEEGSLYKSTDLGYISERYVYDIPSEGSSSTTTVHALVQITQNGLIPEAKIQEGQDARWSFYSEKEFSADEIIPFCGLGDDAFYFSNTSQVHFVYKDYYIFVAFEMDAYDEANDVGLNMNIAKHIAERLQKNDGSL